jgi:hypothetical protein
LITRARRGGDDPNARAWQTAPKGAVNENIFREVPELEQRQSAIYERFVRLETLYDPNNAAADASENRGVVIENVVASNVDTVKAVVAETEVSPRVETDGADWSQQRRARHLEWYSEALMALHEVHPKARRAFKEAAKKGKGCAKVYADRNKQLHVDHILPDDLIVNDLECRFEQRPRQLHHRQLNVSKEALKIEWPEFKDKIDRAGSARGSGSSGRRVQYSSKRQHETIVIESWFLPVGTKGKKYYRPGRHTICIDGWDLLDEPWEEDFFPIADMDWESRSGSWFGISGAERIVGHQLTLNKLNWQVDRQHDQLAVPTTYVRPADANLATKSTSRLGTIAVYRGADVPKTVIPNSVSGETLNHRERTKSSSFEEFGQSRMTTTATKPPGLDSGIALREYKDQTTQRFATQEKEFERFILHIVWLMLWTCKQLGKDAPVVLRPSRFGKKKIQWSEVDMGDLKVQLAAASTLSRTPAGRLQTVLEWAQAGVIAQDEARRLLNHPDLERSMSLYTAALDKVEYDLERMADGEDVMPDPFTNLEMAAWRSHMQYELWVTDGAPEEVLERVRQYASIAIYFMQQGQTANSNMTAGAGAGAGAAPAAGPMGPGGGAAAPDAGTPQSAFNPMAAQAVA